jgi:hypothetical protein
VSPKKKPVTPETHPPRGKAPHFTEKHPILWSTGAFTLLACALTFPLIIRLNSSVYGFYDHVSTDLFAAVYYYFWWPAREWLLSHSMINPLLNFPFGAKMLLANATGFVMAPVGFLIGHLAAYNLAILANLILSGLGMFLLVRHITKSAGAGFIAGIVFAFCPNMLVRSYTTFDSTQVQWIPFYTLYVVKFLENSTWRNAILSAVFLLCNILFAMPYYLVFLPIHTVVLLVVYALWKSKEGKRGLAGFLKGLLTPEALRSWGKIAVIFAVVVVGFGAYYKVVVGGSAYSVTATRTLADLKSLSLQGRDYLVPHPRSLLLKGDFKETYWDAQNRPEKNADSDVAYIGYLAMLLALLGVWKGRGYARWFFLAGGAVAFWATLGPNVFGLPTPSRLIYQYAPFARRILLYKVYVQFGMAGLAGLGTAYFLGKMKSPGKAAWSLVAASLLILGEYAIVPPFLSVDLTGTPEVYARVKALPAKSAIIEVPLRRMGKNLYQGYIFYQTIHGKPLFNPYVDVGLIKIPERIRPFYHQMEIPLEAGQYANLAALRFLGVTHLVYHPYIGTATVQFRSFSSPDLDSAKVDGLNRIYEGPRSIGELPRGPYDYSFADLHEITAGPCPVALVFDSSSPFDAAKGWTDQDGYIPYGWFSSLMSGPQSFSYPVWNGTRTERLLRGSGRITAVNLSDRLVSFDLSFLAYAEGKRTIEVKWNGAMLAAVEIGPAQTICTAAGFSLPAGGTGEISLDTSGSSYGYMLPIGKEILRVPALAAIADVRAAVK